MDVMIIRSFKKLNLSFSVDSGSNKLMTIKAILSFFFYHKVPTYYLRKKNILLKQCKDGFTYQLRARRSVDPQPQTIIDIRTHLQIDEVLISGSELTPTVFLCNQKITRTSQQ